MGKRQVRTIVVRKSVTASLLALTAAVMIAVTWAVGAHTRVTETRSTRDLVVSAFEHGSTDGFATVATISLLLPVLANVLIFVPWGFLAFLLFDVRSRPRMATYAIAVVGGALFALALSVWQSYFPARLIATSDVFANAIGAALGASLGQLRKDVRVRFEP